MKFMPERGRRLSRLGKCFLLTLGLATLVGGLQVKLTALLWRLPGEEYSGEKAGWIGDYDLVLRTLESSYPSLEWTIERHAVDLPELQRQTRDRLYLAKTRGQARRAIQNFVNAFGDGHFRAFPPRPRRLETVRLTVDTLSAQTPAENACATLGYDRRFSEELPFLFDGLGKFEELDDDNAFRGGVLVLAGYRIGLVRAGSFDLRSFGRACRDEWNELRLSLATTCEAPCVARFHAAVADRLLRQFESRIRQFEARGAELVVLDLTGNHGGNGWADGIGRILAGRELPEPPVSLLRDRWSVAELESEMKRLDRALAFCGRADRGRVALEDSYAQLNTARMEALAPCQRMSVWYARAPRPVCSQLTSPIRLDQSALAELDDPPGGAVRSVSAALEPVRSREPRVSWHGPTAVLIDEETASMAELLAGQLKDYAGAVLIGMKSNGCGAGWHRGDWPVRLEHVGLELHVPDHVAYRRDGLSYRGGVEPDIETSWSSKSPQGEMARHLVVALRKLFSSRRQSEGHVRLPVSMMGDRGQSRPSAVVLQ